MQDFLAAGGAPETAEQIKLHTTFLPSVYARTNDVEWFAEVFGHSIAYGDKEGIKWLQSLIK